MPAPTPPAVVEVHHSHETFPNPCATFDNYSVASGVWTSAATWNAGVPTATQRVVIDGHTVTQDGADAQVGSLYVMGTGKLYHGYAADTTLTFDTLIFDDTAEWHAHGATEADPIPAGITCRLVRRDTALPAPLSAQDPKQHTGGVICADNTKVRLRGAPKTSLAPALRLAVAPQAGHTTLTFVAAPSGWQAGDTVVVPPTDPYYSDGDSNLRSYDFLFEEKTIAGVAGAVVTLTSALARNHNGCPDPMGTGRPTLMPHAMDVTRNLRIESANAAVPGTRGHMMFAERCDAQLRYVEIKDFGRTQGATIDTTTNLIGRYPIHCHHCFGAVNVANTGYQGVIEGCAIRGGKKWPIAIHGTCYFLVKGNDIYGGEHSLIAFEDGNEAYNRIEGNAFFGVRGPDSGGGVTVSNALWFLQPAGNEVIDNVGAGGRHSDYQPHFWHLDGLKRGGQPVLNGDGTQSLPLHRGGDVMHGVEGVDFENLVFGVTNWGENHGNECYAYTKGPSVDHWNHNTPVVPLTYGPVTVWHVYIESFFVYGGNQPVTIDGMVAWETGESGMGLNDHHAIVTMRNCDIRNVVGIGGRAGPVGLQHAGGLSPRQGLIMEDSYVAGPVPFELVFPTGAGTDPAVSRDDVFRRVTVANPAGQATPVFYKLRSTWSGQVSCIICLPYPIDVYDHQGVAGDNFRIYYKEQLGSAILLAESELPAPAPGQIKYGGLTVGHTNLQALAAHGRCWGNEIIPAGAAGPDPPGFPGAYTAAFTVATPPPNVAFFHHAATGHWNGWMGSGF